MATIKNLSLKALIPENALGTKFVTTGFLAENYKTIEDSNGKKTETSEIECYSVGVQLLDPKNEKLNRISMVVKVKGLTAIDKKLEDTLLSYSIVSFDELKCGEFKGSFWVNAANMNIVENRGVSK